MSDIETLIERINDFYQHHGTYPMGKVSMKFWDNNADEIAKLVGDGIAFQVVDYLESRASYLLSGIPRKGVEIDILDDLKEYVDKLVEKGMGNWPVVHKKYDADIYTMITLYPITPEHSPYEGLKLNNDFWFAPEGGHILVDFAESYNNG